MTPPSLPRKKLPIGIQTFREIREEGHYYVDKTTFALQLITQGKYFFLSRPRRFGKSLFLDTLKELFEGNKALFQGLYAEDHWDWSVPYPVIRLSFGSGVFKNIEALEAAIVEQLSAHEESYGLTPTMPDIPSRFKRLIRNLHQAKGQRVVVLVDEYDKPILDNLSEPVLALEMRDGLRNLYSVLKDSDAHLKFVFLTGVSKFSKVSIFSGLNNLTDLTLDPVYSALCGYTETDIESVFGPELEELDRQAMRDWYNGYNWLGEAVYNPFDLLLFFRERRFKSFWFETGTPTFLVELLRRERFFTPDLAQLQSDDDLLSRFDVDEIGPEALLWQTGYLTIQQVEPLPSGQEVYVLGYPNREVESALNKALLPAWGPKAQPALVARSNLDRALHQHDLDALRNSVHALFASIPHDWHRKNELAQYEGYYASVFYSQLAALGLDTRVEDATNKGRIDLALRYQNQVYLFEFKVISDSSLTSQAEAPATHSPALQQLIDRGYADKYRAPGVSITLIGITFSKAERNVVGWETAQV